MKITYNELENRFGYHRANAESAPRHSDTREAFLNMAHWLNAELPESRDKSLALTKLQEAMHWANSAIAMENDIDTETPHLPNAPTGE